MANQIHEYRMTRPKLWVGGQPGILVPANKRLGYFVRATSLVEALRKFADRFEGEEVEGQLSRENVGALKFPAGDDEKKPARNPIPSNLQIAAPVSDDGPQIAEGVGA